MSTQWGKRYSNNQSHADDHCCPECDWRPDRKKDFGHDWGKFIVGIDSECSVNRDDKHFVAIFECPKDGKIFWMHLNKGNLIFYKRDYPDKFKDLELPRENKEIKLR